MHFAAFCHYCLFSAALIFLLTGIVVSNPRFGFQRFVLVQIVKTIDGNYQGPDIFLCHRGSGQT
jgi:hypothetical protein